MQGHYITCLYQDAKGNIWIGTNTSGVQILNPRTGKIKKAGEDIFQNNCTICSIIGDNDGRIWISTSTGLFEYDPDTDDFKSYTADNGLPVNQMNFSSSFLSGDGTLFFGSVNGLISFRPDNLNAMPFNAKVHLKKLVLNNKTVKPGDETGALTKAADMTDCLTLKYNMSRSISIEYGVVMPSGADITNYQIWMEDVDKQWRDVNKEHRLTFLNLQPGTYYLHVRANNNVNNDWEGAPVKTLKIEILPPFYRSVPARIIYCLLALLLLWCITRVVYIRIKEKNVLHRARLEKIKYEELDRAKSEFFTSLSHELKTPLTLISSPLKNIAMEKLDEPTRKDVETAVRNADKMEEMVNQLITLNKVQSGNLPFFVRKDNPMKIIKTLAQQFCLQTSQKQITLNIDCEDNCEDVWFSESYVEHITDNLLSNAIKFTPRSGRIILKASIIESGDGFIYLTIEVKDTGQGIPEEDSNKIFDLYYQSANADTATTKGWGVGLSLVKRLCETHKGGIKVESVLGQGSTFTARINVSETAFSDNIKIPALPGQDNDDAVELAAGSTPPENEAQTEDGAKEFSLLLVDDNQEMRDFMRRCFTAQYNVYTAENGVEALKTARKYAIQLIISDVMMPEMDGIELCKKLKEDIATSHIPIILLTAKDSQEDMISCYQSGADAFVTKPFSPHALKLQVKNIVKRLQAQQKRLAGIPEHEDVAADRLSKLDKDFLNKINVTVKENLGNSDFSVEDVTKTIGISRSLLHNKMKSLLNISMGSYIRQKRLEEAKRLLQEGYNVSETAYKTGFSDPNHFSKTFKKQFGMNPGEYVKNGRNKS